MNRDIEENQADIQDSAVPGNAEPQLGISLDPPRGWYNRGYHPHRDHSGLLQTITYRLADSLSSTVLDRIRMELTALVPQKQEAELRRRMEAWLDAGHGSCLLVDPRAATCVVDTWRRFSMERYDLIAWVVMPNHVHVLIRVFEGMRLGKIVQS